MLDAAHKHISSIFLSNQWRLPLSEENVLDKVEVDDHDCEFECQQMQAFIYHVYLKGIVLAKYWYDDGGY